MHFCSGQSNPDGRLSEGLLLRRSHVPLVRKTGYLMFSKRFYAENEVLAERIWDAIGDVWASPIASEIRRSYE